MNLPPSLDIDPKPFLAAMEKMAGEIGQLLATTDLDPSNKELVQGVHTWMLQERATLEGQLDAAITQLKGDYAATLVKAEEITKAQDIQKVKMEKMVSETKTAAELAQKKYLDYQKIQAEASPLVLPSPRKKQEPLPLSPGEVLVGLLFPPPSGQDSGPRTSGQIWENWQQAAPPDTNLLKELLEEEEERNRDKGSRISPAPGQDHPGNIWEEWKQPKE